MCRRRQLVTSGPGAKCLLIKCNKTYIHTTTARIPPPTHRRKKKKKNMADPLGMTASIIALIQLTGALSAFGHGYIGGLRRASADRRRLVAEFASLGLILTHLRDSGSALQGLAGPLADCTRELEALAAKMRPPAKDLRGFWKTLKWPLEQADTLQAVERIERYKTLFHFAVTADHS